MITKYKKSRALIVQGKFVTANAISAKTDFLIMIVAKIVVVALIQKTMCGATYAEVEATFFGALPGDKNFTLMQIAEGENKA